MSVRKVRTKSRAAEEMVCPATSSPSGGQKKVVEYFRTIHRDSAKKFKRLKVFTENDETKTVKHTLESPKKVARLKSPQIPEKETDSGDQEWVLPVTCETEVAQKSNKVKENDNDAKSSSEPAGSSKISRCPRKEMTETDSKEKREQMYDEIKHDLVNVAFAVPCETETNKEDKIDLDILPSAVKLVESIKNSTDSSVIDTFPLPTKYERLLRLFDYTEMVVSWLETQGKRITLNEVMTNVQRQLKSNYDEQQFAMMLSIYPESYNIRCERRWMPIGGRHCNHKEYEYVIEPNLVNDLVLPQKKHVRETSSSKSSPVKSTLGSPCKVPLVSLARNPIPSSPRRVIMKSPTKSPSGSNMVTRCPPKLESRRLHRKLEFKSRLRKLVNIQHAAFLKNEGMFARWLITFVLNDVSVEISPDEQLPRYHPDFDLDAVVDITPAKLPEMPKGDAGQPETMREYLKAVPDSSSTLPEKIKMVIKELRSPEKKVAVVADKCIPLSPKKYVETKNTSKPSLLERIRAKERERKRREMMRNPEMEQRKGSYYNLKKVGSMKFVELIDKLAFSIGIISKVEIEAAINLLCEVCPTYFKIVEVRGEKYIHLKDNNFSAIRDIVNVEIKKCI
uniref:BMA-CDT-1 n=2 Tax=Brugia TaxID=6278 RepID=A0A0J9XTS1_BRUMA|nr:BMA-CDT-1 [Brugia malayi]